MIDVYWFLIYLFFEKNKVIIIIDNEVIGFRLW